MLPSLAMDYRIDSWMAYPILASQTRGDFACRVSLANIANCIFIQLCIDVIRADMHTASCASFTRTVLHIVRLRSQKQMIRIHTVYHVTFVEYPKSIWNWAIVQFIRETMRSIKLFSCIERSVTFASFTSSPQPTVARGALVYLLPKTLNRWTRLVLMAVDESSLSGWKLGDGQRLAASTFTKPQWVRWGNMRMLALSMPNNVLDGLAFNLPSSSFVSAGYRCLLSTATLTVTVRDFVRRIVRGMIGAHKKTPFLCQAQERLQRCLGIYIDVNYRNSLAQMNQVSKRIVNRTAELLEAAAK